MRLMFATPHSASELIERCQAESVGAFNHHYGGVRNVYAHFHHRSGRQNVDFFVQKRRHYFFFFFGFQPTVEQSDFQFRKNFFLKPFVFFGGGLHRQFFRFLDQGADDERLPPIFNFAFYEIVSPFSLGWRNNFGGDIFSPFRQFLYQRQVEIAPDGQTQRPWNRSGRHG